MGPTRSRIRCAGPKRCRSDGWTPERQLAFLDSLADTRSVTRAAIAAAMRRESAYRLRARDPDGLFAALWDRALAPDIAECKGHSETMSNGRLLRLLGNHYRRKRGDFVAIGVRKALVIGPPSDANFVTQVHGTRTVSRGSASISGKSSV